MTKPLRPYYIPVKPKQCDQIWEEMTPTEKGRICAKCEKHIYDFENMKWNEILDVHQNSKAPVCGNYNQKQIKYWGREIPKWYEPYAKYLVSLGIVKLFLSNEPLIANNNADSTFQTQQINQEQIPKEKIKSDTSIVIKGELIHYETYNPIAGAKITLSDIPNSTITDNNGKFELKIDSLNFEYLLKLQNHIKLFIAKDTVINSKYFSTRDIKLHQNIYFFEETFTFNPNGRDYIINDDDIGFSPAVRVTFYKKIYNSFINLFKRGPYKW